MKLACIALPLVIFATHGVDPNASIDEKAVLARYKAECVGKKKVTRSCQRQKRLVEGVYYRSLRRLTASRKKGAVDRKYLVGAAKADFPALRELGLWTLAAEGTESKNRKHIGRVRPEPGFLTAEETQLYVAELNSPYPALRKVAWDALRISKQSRRKGVDERKWGVDEAYRREFASFWRGAPMGLSKDHPPHPDRLRTQPYPKAELQYYASGRGGTVWLTGDALQKVAAYYEKQGFSSINMQQLLDRLEEFQKAKMKELAAKMQSGTDPQALQAEMKDLENLTQELVPGYLFSDKPTDQLALGPAKKAGDATMVAYRVVIWKAPGLNKTGIAIEYNDE